MRGSAPKRITITMTNTEATTKTTAVAKPGIRAAAERAAPNKAAKQKKDGLKTSKAARKKAAKSKPAANKQAQPASNQATPARPGSKKTTILELLRRPNGATLTEIAKATLWQNHSIRGFLSGTLRKKMSLPVESSRNQAGDRTYRLTK
jgi:hypothetical protein